ncbi:chemotaxis protein CheB [Sorangium sp. So ce281]|uniref:chemotaxis protein CheB n=1 Tax=Sorangium sp. So ce281 TaxID=3133293 RepID=UPI003F63E51B
MCRNRTSSRSGASAGGVEALIVLLGGLPADLSASLFVVRHLPPTARSGPRARRRARAMAHDGQKG